MYSRRLAHLSKHFDIPLASSTRTIMTSSHKICLDFPKTTEETEKRAHALMARTKEALDAIANAGANVEEVLEPHARLRREKHVEQSSLDFMHQVSPSKELRTKSEAMDKIMSAFDVECCMRKDVFDKFMELQQKMPDDNSEAKRYVDRVIINGKRDGLHLSEGDRETLTALGKEESDLGISFNANVNADNTQLLFQASELEGLSDDFLSGLKKAEDGSGKLIVTLKYPDYIPIMQRCRNQEVRQKLEKAYTMRCAEENAKILKRLTEIRAQKATILGFPNHADFKLDRLMAKSAATVSQFLSTLRTDLQKLADSDMAILKELREGEGNVGGAAMATYDFTYYRNQVEESRCKVQHEKIQEYFPASHVITEMLGIYQKLLCLRFTQLDIAKENVPIWMSADEVAQYSVQCYEVRDSKDDHLLGYFYLDLYPREGKFGHAAQFGLQPGCTGTRGEGDRMFSAVVLVCNFTPPSATKPSLLLHTEVVTFFHEFGHCMHSLCAEGVIYPMFSGTKVERDFVECPSQMLENWCWEKPILRLLSKHYGSGNTIPDELVDPLIASRLANEGVNNMRQISLSTYDQTIHTAGLKNAEQVGQLFGEITNDIVGVQCTPGTSMPSSWGHMVGYDAQYYGYLWAEVISADLFESKFKVGDHLLNPEAGLEYRNKVLRPGGTLDAVDILKNYLGREPTNKAWLRQKGLAQ